MFRLKLYAQTDNDYRNIIDKSKLTLEETEILINLIIKIVFEINSLAFGTLYQYEPIHKKESVRNIIESLLNKREDDKKKVIKNFIDRSKKKSNQMKWIIFY